MQSANTIQSNYYSPTGLQPISQNADSSDFVLSLLGGGLLNGLGGSGSGGGDGESSGSGAGGGIGNIASGIISQLGGVMDLIRCWGSSWNPTKAKTYATNHIQKYELDFNNALNGNLTQNNVATINSMLWAYYIDFHDEDWWVQFGNPGSCSRDSIKGMLPSLYSFGDALMNQIVSSFESNGLKVSKTSKTHMVNNNHPWEITQIKYDGVVSTGGGLFSGGGGSSSGVPAISSRVKTAGGILLVATGVGTALYNMFKGSKTKNKNKWIK